MMQQEATPILNVSHLSKTFPIKRNIAEIARKKEQKYVRAVEDVTFSIRKGETLGLVGESGCGKSTLSKTLIRLYKPDDGKIMFDQYGDLALKEGAALTKARRDIQMVYQDPYSSLNPKMTIRQMFYEILSVHHICPKEEFEKKTIEILDMVGMPSYALDRYPSAFSGGQRQRIGIARALILNPALLIADEPVSALDMSIQAQIINLLKNLQKKYNLTYLFISHDLSVVEYISDTVGVMYLGNLVEYGATEDIFRNPLHPYTKGLLSCIPIADPKLARAHASTGVEGDLPSPVNPKPGCRFCGRCPYAKPICSEQTPAMKEAAPGHFVACHLY